MSHENERAERSTTPAPIRPAALWFAVLGGIVAWALHLGISYAVIPYVCGTGGTFVLHALTLGAASTAGAATFLAWRAFRRSGSGAGAGFRAALRGAAGVEESVRDQTGGPIELATGEDATVRAHAFLALSGVLISGFFFLVIVVEWLPVLGQADPCRHIPLGDQPIVMAGWGQWHPDAWILGSLALALAVYLRGLHNLWKRAGKGRVIERWRALSYLAGIALLFIALVSPVHALGEALFSMHMVQHLLLMVGAAPLMVLGRPGLAGFWAVPPTGRRRLARGWTRTRLPEAAWRALTHPGVILVLHVGALWVWHLPEVYQAALTSRLVHHLEHASFFFTAVLFWWALALAPGRRRWPGHGAGILYVFGTALQSGALGALILFAPRPWYPAHGAGAAAWGVDPLVDQQVAGILMWVPAGLVYAAAILALFLSWLGQAERAAARRERIGWGSFPAEPFDAQEPARAGPAAPLPDDEPGHLVGERADDHLGVPPGGDADDHPDARTARTARTKVHTQGGTA